MAGGGNEDVKDWGRELNAVADRVGVRFPRSETRDRVRAYLIGLLGPVRRSQRSIFRSLPKTDRKTSFTRKRRLRILLDFSTTGARSGSGEPISERSGQR